MKILLKLSAVIIAAAGAVGLGWVFNYISSNAQYLAIGMLGILAVIFIGGGAIVALFIFLWGRASGDFDTKVHTESNETESDNQQDE